MRLLTALLMPRPFFDIPRLTCSHSEEGLMRGCTGWLVIAALSAGCSSYVVPRYGVSVTNVAALRQVGAQKVSVKEFTASGGSKSEIG
jgi:hypothetical protein